MHPWLFARRFLCVLFMLLGAASASGAPAGEGAIEDVRVLPGRELALRGWAAAHGTAIFTSQLIVRLDDREVYRGRMQRLDRPDIAQSRGRPDWWTSGFAARVRLPADAAGTARVSATVVLTDGTRIDLPVPAAAQRLDLGAAAPRAAPLAWLLLALAVVAPLAALRHARATRFGIALAFSFLCLVAGGWTGSSLQKAFDDTALVQRDGATVLGEPRWVRSDEWQVITPLAIAQAQHQPAFPVVNRHLGPDGQNMLVVGMTGMPVAHLSSLAKPATWGFFLFDLRRALAWAWWFPFFACFAAFTALLVRVFALEWRLAAALALTVSASPYAIVFSGWPAYAAFFPAAGWLAADAALRARGTVRGLASGAALGLAAAGFVLVLYPAWQITLGTLFLPLVAAWAWRERERFVFGRVQAWALALAAGVTALVLGAWWADAREAVEAMRATVYPGQRSLEVGGDADRWYLLKGLLSPSTMHGSSPLLFGASDAGSVALFVVPALALLAWRWRAERRVDPVTAVAGLYVVWTLLYLFVGLPPALARLTLWGSTTWYRLDLALGVAQLVLIAGLLAPRTAPAGLSVRAAAVLAALVAAHGVWLFWRMPPDIADGISPPYVMVAIAALGAAAFALARERAWAFAAIALALALPASLTFNPIGVAAKQVSPAPDWREALAQAAGQRGSARHGVAVVRERSTAMALAAAGVPVTNAVFYTPPAALWRRLDPRGEALHLHNRYQRLMLVPGAVAGESGFRIESPRLDEVHLVFDPARFDFRLLGAGGVWAGPADAAALQANPALRLLRASAAGSLFEVRP